MGFEVVGAFGGDEDLRGGEAVREGVDAGAGFAVRGAGSGAELGVAAIGFLLFSRHWDDLVGVLSVEGCTEGVEGRVGWEGKWLSTCDLLGWWPT